MNLMDYSSLHRPVTPYRHLSNDSYHGCSSEETTQFFKTLPSILLLGGPLSSHCHIRKGFLLALQLQHLLFKTVLHDIPLDEDCPLLTQPMYAIHCLSFSGRVELRLHDVDLVSSGEIETEATSTNGDEHNADFGIVRKGLEGAVAVLAVHSAIEARVDVAVSLKSDLNKVEMCGPRREDDTICYVSSGSTALKGTTYLLIGGSD